MQRALFYMKKGLVMNLYRVYVISFLANAYDPTKVISLTCIAVYMHGDIKMLFIVSCKNLLSNAYLMRVRQNMCCDQPNISFDFFLNLLFLPFSKYYPKKHYFILFLIRHNEEISF